MALFSRTDAIALAQLGILGLVERGCSPSQWTRVSQRLAGAFAALRPAHSRRLARRIGSITGGGCPALAPSNAEARILATRIERVLHVLRVVREPGFTLDVELVGQEHLRAALRAGRGAIVWAGRFRFANLLEPMALHSAGIRLCLLSLWNHGVSSSLFGQRQLNPLFTRGENRFLAERLVMRPGSLSALVELRRRLTQNRVVCMRANAAAATLLDLPFLRGRIRLASGPAALAHATGAPLIPSFAVRRSSGGFAVRLEAPIAVSQALERDQAVREAASAYVARLEPQVWRHAEQWLGWLDQAYPADGQTRGVHTVRGKSHVLPRPGERVVRP